MIQNSSLPQQLVLNIGSEPKDFSVQALRTQSIKKSIPLLIFGAIWTSFSGLVGGVFLGPLFLGKEVHFETNGMPTVASPDNLEPIVLPAIIIGVFLFIGVGMMLRSLFLIFKKGGYFVGTPTRLIYFKNGNIRSIDWEQFSGDIEVNGNSQKGDILLGLRTGNMVSTKNGASRFVPESIDIAGVSNAFEIEQICRKRIKENDPTPRMVSSR